MKIKELIQKLSAFDPEAEASCLRYKDGVVIKEKRKVPLHLLYTDGSLFDISEECLPVLGPTVFLQTPKIKKTFRLVVG